MMVLKIAWLLLVSLGGCLRLNALSPDEGDAAGVVGENVEGVVEFSGGYYAHSNPAGEGGGGGGSEQDDAGDGDLPIPIMIMALARSGSTLIGDLFRNDNDTFYMYEPCRSRGRGVLDDYKMLNREACLDYLHRIFRCDFTVNDADQLLSDKGAVRHSSPIFQEMREALDMGGTSEGGGTSARDVIDHGHHVLLDTCKNSRAVVIKTIRVYDGVDESTSSLVSGVNVLHLVRDPRAVVRSELMHFGVGHFRDDLANFRELESISDPIKRLTEERRAVGGILCGYYRMQLDSRPYLKGKYLRVRYEDFSMLPQTVAQLIFSYFGLGDVPPSLNAWIQENTSMENCGDAAESGTRRGLRRNENHQLLPFGRRGARSLSSSGNAGYATEDNERTFVAEATSADPAASSADTSAAVPQSRRMMLRSTGKPVGPFAAELETSPPPERHGKHSDPSITGRSGAGPSHGPPTSDVSATVVASQGITGGANVFQAAVSDGEVVITKEGRRALGEVSCSNELEAKEHPFDTKRDSRAMAYQWREEMSREDTIAVWEACEDSRVMVDLKYSP